MALLGLGFIRLALGFYEEAARARLLLIMVVRLTVHAHRGGVGASTDSRPESWPARTRARGGRHAADKLARIVSDRREGKGRGRLRWLRLALLGRARKQRERGGPRARERRGACGEEERADDWAIRPKTREGR